MTPHPEQWPLERAFAVALCAGGILWIIILAAVGVL